MHGGSVGRPVGCGAAAEDIDGHAKVLGSAPTRVLASAGASMIKRTALPEERKRELQADFRKNVP